MDRQGLPTQGGVMRVTLVGQWQGAGTSEARLSCDPTGEPD